MAGEPLVLQFDVDDKGTVKLTRLKGELRSTAQELDRGARGAQQTDRALHQMGQGAGVASRAVGQLRTMFAGFLGVYGIRAVITAVAGFEAQMSRVAAISRATASEMAQLEQTARSLALATVYTATEVGQGMQFMAQAGFNTNQIIGTLPATLDLAAAGAISVADAARIMANTVRSMGLEISEATHVADVFAEVQARANTDVLQMGDAMRYVGAIARSFDVSLEELAATMAVMANNGMVGSMAGTGLRRVISSLVAPSREAQRVLQRYGLTVADVNVEAVGLTNALEALISRGFRGADVFAVFGDRGAAAFNVLSETIPELRALYDSLQDIDGVARRMAETTLDNAAGAWTLFKATLLEFAETAVYDTGILGGLEAAVRSLNDALVTLMDIENQAAFVRITTAEALRPHTATLAAIRSQMGEEALLLQSIQSWDEVIAELGGAPSARDRMLERIFARMRRQAPYGGDKFHRAKMELTDHSDLLRQLGEQLDSMRVMAETERQLNQLRVRGGQMTGVQAYQAEFQVRQQMLEIQRDTLRMAAEETTSTQEKVDLYRQLGEVLNQIKSLETEYPLQMAIFQQEREQQQVRNAEQLLQYTRLQRQADLERLQTEIEMATRADQLRVQLGQMTPAEAYQREFEHQRRMLEMQREAVRLALEETTATREKIQLQSELEQIQIRLKGLLDEYPLQMQVIAEQSRVTLGEQIDAVMRLGDALSQVLGKLNEDLGGFMSRLLSNIRLAIELVRAVQGVQAAFGGGGGLGSLFGSFFGGPAGAAAGGAGAAIGGGLAVASAPATPQVSVPLQIVNVVDPSQFGAWAKSKSGRRTITNVIREERAGGWRRG